MLRASPATGENWGYEVKLHGYRAQIRKSGGTATSRRFPTLARRFSPYRRGVDGEVIAAGVHVEPDLLARVHGPNTGLRLCCDLMELPGAISVMPTRCWPNVFGAA